MTPALPFGGLPMKIHLLAVSLVLTTLSVVCAGQCPKAGTKPVWDANKDQFRCADPAATSESVQSAIVPPTGDKSSCKNVRDDLQRTCPTPDEGKSCKNAAKSIYEACYKGSESSSGSAASSSPSSRTDASTCMTTYQQQQQACRTRVTPPRVPGQPYVPDTCMSDALAAQNKCLANAR
jgi:hypothetical protein